MEISKKKMFCLRVARRSLPAVSVCMTPVRRREEVGALVWHFSCLFSTIYLPIYCQTTDTVPPPHPIAIVSGENLNFHCVWNTFFFHIFDFNSFDVAKSWIFMANMGRWDFALWWSVNFPVGDCEPLLSYLNRKIFVTRRVEWRSGNVNIFTDSFEICENEWYTSIEQDRQNPPQAG